MLVSVAPTLTLDPSVEVAGAVVPDARRRMRARRSNRAGASFQDRATLPPVEAVALKEVGAG